MRPHIPTESSPEHSELMTSRCYFLRLSCPVKAVNADLVSFGHRHSVTCTYHILPHLQQNRHCLVIRCRWDRRCHERRPGTDAALRPCGLAMLCSQYPLRPRPAAEVPQGPAAQPARLRLAEAGGTLPMPVEYAIPLIGALLKTSPQNF